MTTEAISHLDGPEFEGIFEPGGEPRPVGGRPRRKRPSAKLVHQVRVECDLDDATAERVADWAADWGDRLAASTARPVFDMNGHGPMWSDGHVTDRPVTCQKCIRHQALAEMVDIALEHDLYEATPDTTPCPDCEWTDAQDLWEPEAHRVLAHPCPKHTHTEEDQ